VRRISVRQSKWAFRSAGDSCKKGEGFGIPSPFQLPNQSGELKPYLVFFSIDLSGAAGAAGAAVIDVSVPPGAGAAAPGCPGALASGAGGAAGAGAGGGGGGSSFFPHPAKARVKIKRLTIDHEATRFPILVHLLSTTQEPACYEFVLHKFQILARGSKYYQDARFGGPSAGSSVRPAASVFGNDSGAVGTDSLTGAGVGERAEDI